MSEHEKLAVWLDATADAYDRFAIDPCGFRPADTDLILAFAEDTSGATRTANLARFAAAALRALMVFAGEEAWEGDGLPVSVIAEQALACAEPLRGYMRPPDPPKADQAALGMEK